jgi:hypothetical protein
MSFYFREPLHADGVDLCDPVLEGCPCDFILHLAITQGAFEGDELPLLESLGELREIPPGIDAMPFGAGSLDINDDIGFRFATAR